MSSKKPVILIIIHTSLGELRWILPFMMEMRNRGDLDDKEVVTLFFQKRNYELAKKDTQHFELLNALGGIILKKDIFSFLLRERKRVKYIFKDFWPLTKKSLATQMYWLCPDARLILFPHANALFSISPKANTAQENTEKHDFACFDSLIVNSKYDLDYWSSRIPDERIRVVGSASYSAKWIESLASPESKSPDNSETLDRVFLNIRGPHEVYLSPSNFEYLMDVALSELMRHKDVYVIIRPHPRQDMDKLAFLLKDYDPNRYEISFKSIFDYYGTISFSVNFWSSIITDCVAMRVPSIELYRYEGFWDLLTRDSNGNSISFYSHFEMTDAASDKETLRTKIELIRSNREEILNKQLLAFKNVFMSPQAVSLKDLHDIQGNTNNGKRKNARKSLSWFRVLISSIK